jgi:hypothetical protein
MNYDFHFLDHLWLYRLGLISGSGIYVYLLDYLGCIHLAMITIVSAFGCIVLVHKAPVSCVLFVCFLFGSIIL